MKVVLASRYVQLLSVDEGVDKNEMSFKEENDENKSKAVSKFHQHLRGLGIKLLVYSSLFSYFF